MQLSKSKGATNYEENIRHDDCGTSKRNWMFCAGMALLGEKKYM